MTEREFLNLERGDLIRHKGSADSMVVIETLGDGTAIAARTTHVMNADEWLLIDKAKYNT